MGSWFLLQFCSVEIHSLSWRGLDFSWWINFPGLWLLMSFGHTKCQLLFLSGFLLSVTCSVSSHHWMSWGLERKGSMCLVVYLSTASFSSLNGCLRPWLAVCVWLVFHSSELKHPANGHTHPQLQNACQTSQRNYQYFLHVPLPRPPWTLGPALWRVLWLSRANGTANHSVQLEFLIFNRNCQFGPKVYVEMPYILVVKIILKKREQRRV